MSDEGRAAQRFIELLAGRWTLAVLAELAERGCRYQELDDALDGVSHKVLTDTLRRAERDGLVERDLDPSRVDTATLYQLTDLGRTLEEPLAALGRWVDDHWLDVDRARGRWSRRSEEVTRECRRIPLGNTGLVEVPFCLGVLVWSFALLGSRFLGA
ncbi:MAG: winged helix-turn-helix transcriptional regulator [Acidimicrobiales bacterium]